MSFRPAGSNTLHWWGWNLSRRVTVPNNLHLTKFFNINSPHRRIPCGIGEGGQRCPKCPKSRHFGAFSPLRGDIGIRALVHLLISALYKLFVCLLNFLFYFLPSLLSSFFIPSSLLIYFLTHLLPDLYMYFFQVPVNTNQVKFGTEENNVGLRAHENCGPD